MGKPNLIVDKPLLSKIINLKFKNIPSLNKATESLNPDTIFHYRTRLYERPDSSKYYIFNSLNTCSLDILNCNKEIYEILNNYISIDDNIEIFQPLNNETYQLIPLTYRQTTWYKGMLCYEEL